VRPRESPKDPIQTEREREREREREKERESPRKPTDGKREKKSPQS
jgi:hypothetical protein